MILDLGFWLTEFLHPTSIELLYHCERVYVFNTVLCTAYHVDIYISYYKPVT